jgi:hypothetical protein
MGEPSTTEKQPREAENSPVRGGVLDYPGIEDYRKKILDSAAYGIAGYALSKREQSERIAKTLLAKIAGVAQDQPFLDATEEKLEKAFGYFESAGRSFDARVEGILHDAQNDNLDQSAAKAAPQLLLTLELQYLKEVAEEPPTLYKSHPASISLRRHFFSVYVDALLRQSEWKTRIEEYKAEHEENFWKWVQGAWRLRKKDPSDISTDLENVTRNSADKVPDFPDDLSAPLEAAVEARLQAECFRRFTNRIVGKESAWNKNGINVWDISCFGNVSKKDPKSEKPYKFITSPFRDYATQHDLYLNGMKPPYGDKEQRDVLKYRSAPSTSRHHWGTDYDFYCLNNEAFTTGLLSNVYAFFDRLACHFGFVQTYTAFDENSLRAEKVDWYRFEKAEKSDDFLPRSLSAQDVRSYEEERWHWSYWPVAESLLQIVKENLEEAHRRKVILWGENKKFTYPLKYWPDYVCNVNPMRAFGYETE